MQCWLTVTLAVVCVMLAVCLVRTFRRLERLTDTLSRMETSRATFHDSVVKQAAVTVHDADAVGTLRRKWQESYSAAYEKRRFDAGVPWEPRAFVSRRTMDINLN